MTGYAVDQFREGTYVNGVYVPISEVAVCLRCGLARQTRPGRTTSGLCRDCKIQQAADDAAWLTFHPTPTMSAEDRAWCERAAEAGFWRQWERANRADDVDEATVQKAREMSRRYPQPTCGLLSTPRVESGLPQNGERMSNSNQSIKGVA